MLNPKPYSIEISVDNCEELNLIRTNLLTAIKLIADSNEYHDQKSEVTHSIGTLVELIRALD